MVQKLFFISLLFLLLGCKESTDESPTERALRVRSEQHLKYYLVQDVSPPRIVEEGILFTFAENYSSVEVSGDFNNWENSIPLVKGRYGVFYYLLQKPLKAGRYTYRYRVNGVWMNEPLEEHFVYDDAYQKVSFFDIETDMVFYVSNPLYNDDGTVTFFYSNNAAKEVMFTSDKLGFNTSRYAMTKSEDDIWRITLMVGAGDYFYNFVVDRNWVVDPVNLNVVQGNDDRLHSYTFVTEN